MTTFAVIEGNKVINTIIADSKAIAEEITGATCVQYTTEPAETGGSYIDGKFIQVKPFPSWISDGDSGWKAPIDQPASDEKNPKNYTWDETTKSWIESSIE